MRIETVPPALVLEGLTYAPPGEPPSVAGVDWRVPAGAFHCLVGRSGCGKTTLLKLAAGLLAPQAGLVRYGMGQGLGFVFQEPTLLGWLDARDNVLLPLSLAGRVGARERAHAEALLALVGLAGLEHRLPQQLSGGQQARVAIARALVAEPALLLLDEPFAALDAITREELQVDLAALCAQRGTSVLFVTHDIAEAVFLADEVAVMAEGRLAGSLHIAAGRPRTAEWRYAPEFVAHGRALRTLMAGGAA